MPYIESQSGGAGGTLAELFKNYALNGTEYSGDNFFDFTAYSGRISINEGRVCVNTTSHNVYVYIDYSMTEELGSTDWYALATLSTAFNSYLPTQKTTTKEGQNMITNSGSKGFFIGQNSSSVPGLYVVKGVDTSVGQRFIVYGGWTY